MEGWGGGYKRLERKIGISRNGKLAKSEEKKITSELMSEERSKATYLSRVTRTGLKVLSSVATWFVVVCLLVFKGMGEGGEKENNLLFFFRLTLHGLTFTWWVCYNLCPWHKQTELAQSFLFCSCIYFCLYGPFNRTSFHKFPRQLSVFSLCSSSLISALLFLSTLCLFMKISCNP